MHKTSSQRKVSPPGPSFMSSDQVATYLKDLRSNRPARPTGSRPYPGRSAVSTTNLPDNLPPRASSAFSMHRPVEDEIEDHARSGSAMSHRHTNSYVPAGGGIGRPLAQEPRTHSIRKNTFPAQIHSRKISIPASSVPSYKEDGQRRQEKEEARALREALRRMDVQDDISLHQAAQDEATELVWMHQNPGKSYKNPYAPYSNPDANAAKQNYVVNGPGSPTNQLDKSSGSSISSDGNSSPDSLRKRSSLAGASKKNLKVNFKLPDDEPEPPLDPKPRAVSNDSSKGIFRNPNDQIYEEPTDVQRQHEEKPAFPKSDSSALQNKPRNALGRVPRPLPWLQNRVKNSPITDKISRFEIQNDPPTQSRHAGHTRNESATPSPSQSHNAGYTRNEGASPTPPPSEQKDEDFPPNGPRERRSDDIRAATSKRRSDRSEKLPMPSAVSDRVGRPIVSFDKSWKPSDQPKPERPSLPVIEVAAPTIEVSAPSIEVSEAPPIPVINVPDIKVPTISEIETASKQANKPVSQPTRSSPTKQSPRNSQGLDRRTVGTRHTHDLVSRLQAVNYVRFRFPGKSSPLADEPESSRNERLATEVDDHEARVPRFYCHLDFHEMFSPRCKSCKTPIEGEVVVACGAEWHVGHFFCAECGDPFDSQTPFVEKDGFAWCLHCHSRRTAPRCLGCKQHILDDVVTTAIGGQWHERCFNCHECGEGFGPEGRFFVREGEPRRTAKGRIIGGPVQLAICERCEGIRLKAPGMC
ncbi:hypothetical protein N7535_006710 [Penicillium sp. DV-2018c]|nr:hypothetical protein N7535_006710 [Penicillium sp. DV-2018c]